MSFGLINFLSPFWLLAFVGLPALWWLLRLVPPLPRRIKFPAIMLLRDLVPQSVASARAPWWLLAVRLAIITGVILYLAQPVIGRQSESVADKRNLLLVVDNDWAAARDWSDRLTTLRSILLSAKRAGQKVAILPTANVAAEDGAGPLLFRDAREVEENLASLKPEAWSADWEATAQYLKTIPQAESSAGHVIWLSSGLGGQDALNLHEQMRQWAAVDVYTTKTPVLMLRDVTEQSGALTVRVDSSVIGTDNPATEVTALDDKGRVLSRTPVAFSDSSGTGQAVMTLPAELRNQLRRLNVGVGASAGQSWLFDSSWQKKSVGLIGDSQSLRQNSYLNPATYLYRALQGAVDFHVGSVDDLLAAQPSLILMPDQQVAEASLDELLAWVKSGGTLVRFANEGSIEAVGQSLRELNPVMIRPEQRNLGGALSWDKPEKIQPFLPASPFAGLTIPDDVIVKRQWLAEPDSIAATTIWAQLQDGTPLVTSKLVGQGRSVLFHVPARPGWSNLPISGLFVDMLRRMVDLSAVPGGAAHTLQPLTVLPPLAVMDGDGILHNPQGLAQGNKLFSNMQVSVMPISLGDTEGGTSNADASWVPSAKNPPGLYGTSTETHAFNLGAALPPMALLSDRLNVRQYDDVSSRYDLEGLLLALTLLLVLIDGVISFYLRGVLVAGSLRRQTLAVIRFLASVTILSISFGANPTFARTGADEDLSATTHIAYVRTGNNSIDRVSEAGLRSLARVIERRTLIQPIDARGVDLEKDDLVFYPLLYWPLSVGTKALSPAAAARVNNYLRHRGMILFDNIGDVPLPLLRQEKLTGLDLPMLVPFPDGHVLGRSFYLLDKFVGRSDHADFWLQPASEAGDDGVASVLLGQNNYAAAWAADENGKFLFTCEPGGEAQREYAFRFGVNLVMYALAGNYKSDQLHAESLLQRLGR